MGWDGVGETVAMCTCKHVLEGG